MRVCVVEGCGRPHKARGYCKPHYRFFKRYEDPNAPVKAPTRTHGTHSSYSNGCRCELCRKGQADYMREYQRRKRGGVS